MNMRPLGPEPSALPTALHPVSFFIIESIFHSVKRKIPIFALLWIEIPRTPRSGTTTKPWLIFVLPTEMKDVVCLTSFPGRYIIYTVKTATGPITSRTIQQSCAFRRAAFCYFAIKRMSTDYMSITQAAEKRSIPSSAERAREEKL